MNAEDRQTAPLTPREQQVMAYIAAGKPNKVVAIDLGISMRTVEKHRARIFSKLGVRNAVELVHRCYRTPSRMPLTPIMTPSAHYRAGLEAGVPPRAVQNSRHCRLCGSVLSRCRAELSQYDGETPDPAT